MSSATRNTREFLLFRGKLRQALRREFGRMAAPLWGNQFARILSISQAPSISVIRRGQPFFDKSGERLRREWYRVSDETFYNQDNFYFTTVGMHFPGKDGKGGDKKPDTTFARRWLPREISYLHPKLVLVVGLAAAEFLFPRRDFGSLVASDQRLLGVPAFVLPHPSPRNVRWFRDHPGFFRTRLPRICRAVHRALAR